jgi:hypothetical protein
MGLRGDLKLSGAGAEEKVGGAGDDAEKGDPLAFDWVGVWEVAEADFDALALADTSLCFALGRGRPFVGVEEDGSGATGSVASSAVVDSDDETALSLEAVVMGS